MKNKEIKDRLDAIIEKMQSSFDILWEDNLEESVQVIRTDDNDWLDELFELQKKIKS